MTRVCSARYTNAPSVVSSMDAPIPRNKAIAVDCSCSPRAEATTLVVIVGSNVGMMNSRISVCPPYRHSSMAFLRRSCGVDISTPIRNKGK